MASFSSAPRAHVPGWGSSACTQVPYRFEPSYNPSIRALICFSASPAAAAAAATPLIAFPYLPDLFLPRHASPVRF